MSRHKINFKSKFTMMAEQATERFQQGGYVNGDYVRLKKNIKSSDYYKELPAQTQEKINVILSSDLHLRISAIKSIRPAGYSNDGSPNAAADYFVDVVQEYAPGLYKDPLTLPVTVIEYIDSADAMGRMAPPDSQVYKQNVHGPEEVKTNDKDRTLATKDTKLKGANSWQNKPGGGGGDGMKPLKKESATLNDEWRLSEAYGQVITKGNKFMTNTDNKLLSEAYGRVREQTANNSLRMKVAQILSKFEDDAFFHYNASGKVDVNKVVRFLLQKDVAGAIDYIESEFTVKNREGEYIPFDFEDLEYDLGELIK